MRALPVEKTPVKAEPTTGVSADRGESAGDQTRKALSMKELRALAQLPIDQRTALFSAYLRREIARGLTYMREVVGPADRVVDVRDSVTGQVRRMVMFGSNNYLGLANDPEVRERTLRHINEHGVGLGGPPMLNGTTVLHRRLERELSDLKGCEDTLLFSSGYAANLGWVTALVERDDALIMDERSHASLIAGSRAVPGERYLFRHNDVDDLGAALRRAGAAGKRNSIVVVEGVYSMDGDTAPLDRIYEVTRAHGGFLVVDDAHGTGVMGEGGRGTPQAFGLEGKIDLVMGTFSKALASSGGFVSGKREVIDYLRFFASTHFFSAAMPPCHIAGVLAALQVMRARPELVRRLHQNVAYLVQGLTRLGLAAQTDSAILPIRVPVGLSIRKLARKLDLAGVFLNAVEYPAVPLGGERFRVSVMATHTPADLDALLHVLDTVGRHSGLLPHPPRTAS